MPGRLPPLDPNSMPHRTDPVPPEMRGLRILFLLAMASSMSTLSMDFFAPSMPNATRGLETSAEAMKSAMILFLLGYGISPFLWGPLADRVGRRRVMLIGIGCYTLASVACMLSSGIGAFSVFRVLQGAGAACTAIIARAVLRDVHGPEGATKAISRMFLVMVWVPITAPLIGGMMNSWFDWRVNFLVMACVSGAVLLASFALLSETHPEHQRAAARESSPWKQILLDPAFLRHTLANMFSYSALLYFLSNYSYVTEAVYAFTVRQNGYVLTAFNIAVSAGFYLVWVAVPRLGTEDSIRAGLWMAALGWIGFCLISLSAGSAFLLMLPFVLIACLGTGMVVSLTVGQALIPFPHAAGTAAALFILVQSIGASLLNSLAGQLFPVSLIALASFLAACGVMALSSSRLLGRSQGF